MSKRRKFTPHFKSQVVLQLLPREKHLAELYCEHQVTAQVVSNWRQQYLACATHAFENKAARSADQVWIAELERLVRRLMMELEIAKQASERLTVVRSRKGSLP